MNEVAIIQRGLDVILFFDVETAPKVEQYVDLPAALRKCWDKKVEQHFNGESHTQFEIQALWMEKAALTAEFSQVVCIVAGIFKEGKFVLRKYVGEYALLEFATMLDSTRRFLCGHNIKEFDIPFLCKQYVMQGQDIPVKLNFSGRKPWEIDVIDTMEVWKFGAYKNFVSLDLISAVLGIPSPKTSMSGNMVGEFFFAGRIDEIADYCGEDVIAVARVVCKLKGLPIEFEIVK